MGKVNVYLPDELEAAVREAGLSISPICQAALREALDEVSDVEPAEPVEPATVTQKT